MTKKVIIVGGVAGGASAAARLRRLDEEARILLFERDDYISFANCGLPYYIGETIKERDKLLVQTPENMKARFKMDVRTNSEVIGIDTDKKKVTVRSKDQGMYEESYDALVLSPGAKALRPNIPGIDSSRIFTLRNIPDTDRVKAYVDQKSVKSAIVIGGGFIGVEMAENLVERGLKVTLVEAAPHILAPFDSDMVVMAEKELVENGVDLMLGDGVKAFKEAGSQIEVTLGSETIVTADLVILAIGVVPETAFLNGSGIELGPKGHIIVDERMRTNIMDIYAVGDAVEVVDFITGEKTAVPLAGPANKQGRIAADNIAGLDSRYKGTQGTSILKVFSLTAASTGANERTLQKARLPYQAIYVHPVAHASYYPAALPLTLKLIFNDQGQVLGAQGIGYDGVDKRIDVIAAVIRLKGTVDDLAELELAYAPPFSAAKDPVNMAGFTAQNVLAGRTHVASWKDMEPAKLSDSTLLDVRTEEEYNNGHVPGSLNIPLDSLRDRMGELDRNKPVIAYCQVGLRGYIADRILTQNGYSVLNITGGYKTISLQEFQPQNHGSESRSSAPELSGTNAPQGSFAKSIDACGLCCPGPLMQVKAAMDTLKQGQILRISASDPGFYEDIKAWSKRTDNQLLDVARAGGIITAFIQKGAHNNSIQQPPAAVLKDNKTMVVFSGDLDKAIASFIIANGAVAMGKKVTMFFTFWGLNILRKHEKVRTQKGLMDKMFSLMMPRGSKRLKLSNMNMLGIGGKMIRKVMKDKNVSSLEELIAAAMANGVEVVACQMSMDVMGLKQEELLDGVKIGGVGYYLGEAEDSNVNLFI
ncbi:FAD-dependent oxidoreductase [Desulfosporosinus sp. PR]|uniref:DsrE/DsrF/DrsH-like family protein n=1 Tax=Candidatus Desulfosporosinus nitrosoreducens TaxID=3401928 RepID=UPI0027F6BA31|nr:DsrE/DsrF/DrsH-like family protein [Desulfosporosinus sp. PR]MDQ7095418.1 FAD-dependent oxidoreductase [Desulfosporosinus sp. PR]